jgi:hypothetical protein
MTEIENKYDTPLERVHDRRETAIIASKAVVSSSSSAAEV